MHITKTTNCTCFKVIGLRSHVIQSNFQLIFWLINEAGDDIMLPFIISESHFLFHQSKITMKKLILFITGVVCALAGLHAQEKPEPVQTGFAPSPVSWQYHAKRISDNTYDLYITALIQPGWHLYSQHQPPDAIAIPTAIKFHTDAIISLEGKTKEIGNLEKDTIASLGISAWQYKGQVDFVQQVKVKNPVPASVIGSITYQVCRNNECLQPETKEFGIRLP
ncbi:MAG: hypothetical protein EPN37_06260 [Chitinophagaceae bacterium]|nr:MAG: hypothetical protein EPN37_06260 [Chitinophagaceae bacterium]